MECFLLISYLPSHTIVNARCDFFASLSFAEFHWVFSRAWSFINVLPEPSSSLNFFSGFALSEIDAPD
jgi:hypothetical protein